MIKAKIIQTKSYDEIFPGISGPVLKFVLVDEETNKALSNEQVHALFSSFEITGVYVILRYSKSKKKLEGPPDAPATGMITNITDDTVYLGDYEVPRRYFLDWYELD